MPRRSGGGRYRGTVLDYDLRLADGQSLTASMTRRVELAAGSNVPIGLDPGSVILLDDGVKPPQVGWTG